MRIPGIHEGKSRMGSLKRTVPGMGTPIRIPTMLRIIKMAAPMRSERLKLLCHGEPSRRM